ncbi:hypothetical protein, partial [Viridibacillus arvi]|uniref:hypothetical protein n=1 Tax=Viridibacillus arvi TaxID=263475 RepID=UPI0034CFFD58
IDNFNITSNSRKIGALAGFTENATIENVKVINSMVKGFRDVGILIGKTQGTTVKRVMTEGTVKGEMAVGGLIGSSSVSLSLENVYTNAKVDSTISHSGGVIGFTQNIVSMKSVYSTSAVTG